MPEVTAQRKLVKSPPELWSELSDAEALARHLGEFGEIRITRLEPETTVEWESDLAAGVVELEPAGWGTRVTMSASLPEPAGGAVPEPEPDQPEPDQPQPEPEAVEQPAAEIAEPQPEASPAPQAEIADPEPVETPPAPRPVEDEPEPEVPVVEPEPAEPEPAAVEPEPAAAEAQPVSAEEPEPRPGFFARLFGWAFEKPENAEQDPVPANEEPRT